MLHSSHLKRSRWDRNVSFCFIPHDLNEASVFQSLLNSWLCAFILVSGLVLFWVCVLQEAGGVGGGQQPDRGDLPDPAATANHLLPPASSLADQRLRQPGTASHTRRWRSLYVDAVLWEFVCVLSGDGCGRSLQRGGRTSSSPPQPLPVTTAALQHGGGPTRRSADPGRASSQFICSISSSGCAQFSFPAFFSLFLYPRPWRRTFLSAMWSHPSPIRRGERGCCWICSSPSCWQSALEAKVQSWRPLLQGANAYCECDWDYKTLTSPVNVSVQTAPTWSSPRSSSSSRQSSTSSCLPGSSPPPAPRTSCWTPPRLTAPRRATRGRICAGRD